MKNYMFLKAKVVALGVVLMLAQGLHATTVPTDSLWKNFSKPLATQLGKLTSSMSESSVSKNCASWWKDTGESCYKSMMTWLGDNRYAVGVVTGAVCLGLAYRWYTAKPTSEDSDSGLKRPKSSGCTIL